MEILFYHISFGISAQTLFRGNTVVLIELYLQISKEVNPSLSTTTWQVFTFVNFSRSKFAKNSYFETSWLDIRSGSRAAATSRTKHFMIIVNGWKPFTIIKKTSILDNAAVLDPPLDMLNKYPVEGK